MRRPHVPPVLLGVIALAAITTSTAPELGTAPMPCPRGVLLAESSKASIADVLRAAERQLARETINSQGRIYHLTPRNAPITLLERIATIGNGSPLDQRVPGLGAVHRAAVSACGIAIAQASWAIHYEIPIAVIAGLGPYPFFVKTRSGWRFWGSWCGADKPRQWRNSNC